MPEATMIAAGTPAWAELGAEDWQAANAFYAKLFGWEAREVEGHDDHDWTFQVLGDKKVAGIGKIKKWEPQGWNPMIVVADAAATAKAGEAARGTVVAEPAGGDEGTQAILADPSGTLFVVWQAGFWAGSGEIFNTPGAICWTELVCSDWETAEAFYGVVFGWTTESRDDRYRLWKLGDKSIGGIDIQPGLDKPYWLTYFGVSDCDQAVRDAQAAGATVVRETWTMEQGRAAILEDPQHNRFGVFEA